MAQKVATARKMKSRQQTTSPSQVATDGKADNKWQAFINIDMRFFKMQNGNMGPPPPPSRASNQDSTAFCNTTQLAFWSSSGQDEQHVCNYYLNLDPIFKLIQKASQI